MSQESSYNSSVGSAGVLTKEDFGKKPSGVYARWMAELEEAQKDEKRRGFHSNAQKAIDVFSCQLAEDKDNPKYNIFWSYVNLMLDSVFASPPKSVIRAYPGYRTNPAAIRAEEILTRNVDFYIASPDGKFYERAKRAIKDLMLVGRGQLWPRYTISEGTPKRMSLQPGDSPPDGAEVDEDKDGQFYLMPEIKDEDIEIDYVHWKDYRESVARTTDETRWKAKRTFLTKAEASARLGKDVAEKLSYSSKYQSTAEREAANPEEVKHQIYQRAEVWEIHSLEDRDVYFISPGYEKPLKAQGDMNNLTGFYPCPKALCATTSNESTIPTAEYKYLGFLADRINQLETRLDWLTRAAKVVFAYNAKYAKLSDIFNSLETSGIPIEEWDSFAGEDGGFEGVTDFVPIEQYMAAIERIRGELGEKKQEFYELTGYLELTHEDPTGKTPAERQAEALFANPRTQQKQKEVVRFMRDIVSIVAELICQKFDAEKMLTIAGYPVEAPVPPPPPPMPPAPPAPPMPDPSMQDPMMGPPPMGPDAGGPPPSEPPAPPPPDPAQEQFEKDMAEYTLNQDAIKLLKDDVRRHFSMMIETDSTIAVDNRLEKRDRIEFLNMSQTFFQNLQGMSQTGGAFVESACEFFLFGLDAFRVARPLEEKLRADLAKFKEAQANPPEAPPDPRIVAAEKNFELGMKRLELQAQQAEVTSQQKAMDSQMKYEGKMTELQQENQQFFAQLQAMMQDKMAQAEARIQALEVQLEVAEINKGAVISAAQIKAAQVAQGDLNVASLDSQTELQKAQIKANADVSKTAISEHNKMQMHEKGVMADVVTKSHGATLQHKAALKGHEIAEKKAEAKPPAKKE